MKLNPFYFIKELYLSLYWHLNPPLGKSNQYGEPNPRWLEWYQWKFKADLYQAMCAYSILSYEVDEPSPFKDTKAWKKWYRTVNIDRTLTRSQIQNHLTDLHLAAKTASVTPEPELIGKDGDLNLKWAKWYRSTNGTTLFKAKIIGYQEMAKKGVWSLAASKSNFNTPEPSRGNRHEWITWYKERYRVSYQHAETVYRVKTNTTSF